MIQSNELRIGNWVEWVFPNRNNQPNKFQFCEIESIRTSLVGVLGSAYGYDQIQPIPLTPEILEKCGFEKTNRIDFGEPNPCYTNFSLSLMIRHNSYFIDWMGGNIEVKYLHQLQNIYFSLTGEELDVKL